MQLLDNINCIPYGYNPSNVIPEEQPQEPDANPDEEDGKDLAKEIRMDDMFRAIK